MLFWCHLTTPFLVCSNVSRSILAYFHHSGLPDFQDSKGHSLPQATSPQHSTLPRISDALQHGPFQIAVQLLGFKLWVYSCKICLVARMFCVSVVIFGLDDSLPLQVEIVLVCLCSSNNSSTASLTATQSLSNLRVELHLYHFPVLTQQCTLTSPPSGSHELPHLLHGLPQSDGSTSMVSLWDMRTCSHFIPANISIMWQISSMLKFLSGLVFVGFTPIYESHKLLVGSQFNGYFYCTPLAVTRRID